jgi:spermidine synthase/MFS family permease
MRAGAKAVFFVVFTLTGFSALTLQVVWQRVISLHAGVDLVSFTTVVSAFLAGIGIGSLLGGNLADRLGARRSVVAFAASNLLIGAFAWFSIWLFYDLYRNVAPSLTTTAAKFGFNFVLLLVPTVLMGVSLPLVAKGVVQQIADAGSLVGRLYAVNTLGAAAGAATTGWILMGTYGFAATVRIAGTMNLVASLFVIVVSRVGARAGTARDDETDEARADDILVDGSDVVDDEAAAPAGMRAAAAVWPWYVVYGLTGAVALGFEVVFFRMIDTIMRSNSYSFAHVLSVYLVLFGIGSAIAAPIVRRVRRPDQWYLWLQFLVGVAALAGVVVLTKGLNHTPWADAIRGYFGAEGFEIGFRRIDGSEHPEFLQVFFGAPLLVMAIPVLCMGASFPFVQAIVAQRLDTLGRRTGTLLFANVVGNVFGTLFVGFVVIDHLGTAGTYRVLALLLVLPALAATFITHRPALRRVSLALGIVVIMAVLLRFFPSNDYLYATLHGVDLGHIHVAEDRSCANALRVYPSGVEELTVNAAGQNNYPFDDYHVLIGLTPALVHPDPKRTMALGLGIGATPYGLSVDPRVDHVDAVEICGPELPLLRDLGERRSPELKHLFHNPAVDIKVGDGRDFLLRSQDRFDAVVVDTLRPQSAFSGNLYSVEFYELVRDRLTDDGILAQWMPTPRTLNTVLEVFPYVVRFHVPTYFNSIFYLASKSPIVVDRDAILERLDHVDPAHGFSDERLASVREFFRTVPPDCFYDPAHTYPSTEDLLNRDLYPRDEYFLNQNPTVGYRAECAPAS